MLYRWFVGLSLDDPIWDATTFTKNRDRLLESDIAEAFFAEVVAAIKADGLMSDEHFTVDGTLLEAWASHKSFKPKGSDRTPPTDPKNPTVNFHAVGKSVVVTHIVGWRSRFRLPIDMSRSVVRSRRDGDKTPEIHHAHAAPDPSLRGDADVRGGA